MQAEGGAREAVMEKTLAGLRTTGKILRVLDLFHL